MLLLSSCALSVVRTPVRGMMPHVREGSSVSCTVLDPMKLAVNIKSATDS